MFLVEGRKMVTEALASDFPVETILCDAAQAATYASLLSQGEAALLPAHVLAAVCDTKTPQGIAAVVRMGAIAHLGKRLVCRTPAMWEPFCARRTAPAWKVCS